MKADHILLKTRMCFVLYNDLDGPIPHNPSDEASDGPSTL